MELEKCIEQLQKIKDRDILIENAIKYLKQYYAFQSIINYEISKNGEFSIEE